MQPLSTLPKAGRNGVREFSLPTSLSFHPAISCQCLPLTNLKKPDSTSCAPMNFCKVAGWGAERYRVHMKGNTENQYANSFGGQK